MRLEDLTPLVLTYNEAPNIERTLSNLAWAKEIIVLDSFSTDETARLARSHPEVRFHARRFDSHATQWNYGMELVKTEWVLSLDADYICPSELAREIEALTPGEGCVGFEAHFTYVSLGRPLRASLYPPRVVLHRRDKSCYVQDGHTQKLDLDGRVEELQTRILHDDRKPLRVWLQAQERYSIEEARKLRSTPSKDLKWADRIRKRWLAPAVVPLYCLLKKGLLLDGISGWYYTLQRSYAEVLLALRLLERSHPSDWMDE